MKRFALAGAVLALAVPATANAQEPVDPKKAAKAACKTLWKGEGGKAAVRAEYGSLGKCITAWRSEVKAANSNAAKECKAERANPEWRSEDGKTFAEFYGSNKNGKNAYGKCVSSKAKAKVKEQVEEETEANANAAQACKTERRADKDAFRQEYGTNKNKRNAFGKCVLAKKAEQAENGEENDGGENPTP